MAQLKRRVAYLVNVHRHSFRPGEPAKIVGVFIVTPPGTNIPRPCFRVRFRDGKVDYVPVSGTANFRIISEEDLRASRVPAVNYSLPSVLP